MKLLTNIFIINVIIITGITGCKLNPTKTLLVYLMSKHNADYWFAGEKEISFCHAIEWGDTNKMKKMIKEGLNINTRGNMGMTFLIYSYLKSNKKSYEFLLEHRSDPNIVMESNEKPEGWEMKLDFKLSALTLAAEDKSDTFYLKSCLDHGGNPNAIIYRTDGDDIFKRHIMYNALESGSLTNIKLLVEAGSDVNGLKKESGSTPLSISIVANRYDIAYYLLEKGADPEISKDNIIRYIYDHDLELLVGMEKQKEYRKKVIKILEDRGFDFSPENIKKLEEELSKKQKETMDKLNKMYPNKNDK